MTASAAVDPTSVGGDPARDVELAVVDGLPVRASTIVQPDKAGEDEEEAERCCEDAEEGGMGKGCGRAGGACRLDEETEEDDEEFVCMLLVLTDLDPVPVANIGLVSLGCCWLGR